MAYSADSSARIRRPAPGITLPRGRRLARVLACGVFSAGTAMYAQYDPPTPQWPDREWLVQSLIRDIPQTRASQDPESGRFGTEPWICQDQDVLFHLAAAWSLEDDANPHWHSEELLKAICRGGEALTDAQDANGKWTFRKKDNSTWGQIHMPWTYSRWIRAYSLIHHDMPDAARQAWERGLRKGYCRIAGYMDGDVHNITAHHAMGLYIAGRCFKNADWQRAARAYLHRVADAQDPAGFWSENHGPVVGYNHVYVDALGIYYAVSSDRYVLPALRRAAMFHARTLWSDGSAVAAIDERQIYHPRRNIGNTGFSHTREGRGYLWHQTEPLRAKHRCVSADYAAAMLLYGGSGDVIPVIAEQDQSTVVIGPDDALIQRQRPWQFCLSAYHCPVVDNRWIQDRQNLVDVFHDTLGLVVGGGNTKLQPYWSTFTVGNPDLLAHRPGDNDAVFAPDVPLEWVPTKAAITPLDLGALLRLTYGDTRCSTAVEVIDANHLRLTYRAQPADRRVEAHVPLLKRRGRISFASGRHVYLGTDRLELAAADTGGHLTWAGLKMTIPPGARLLWPAPQFNPYDKTGRAAADTAKLVLCLPFGPDRHTYHVHLSRYLPPPFEGLIYRAADLDVMSATGTRMKPLTNLGSFFLGATRLGESMTFTIDVPETATYELLTDFVLFPGYGIVQLYVDGTPIGKPFDAFAPELDTSGPVAFDAVHLTKGPHTISVRLVGRNPDAENLYVSVKRFLLRPVHD